MNPSSSDNRQESGGRRPPQNRRLSSDAHVLAERLKAEYREAFKAMDVASLQEDDDYHRHGDLMYENAKYTGASPDDTDTKLHDLYRRHKDMKDARKREQLRLIDRVIDVAIAGSPHEAEHVGQSAFAFEPDDPRGYGPPMHSTSALGLRYGLSDDPVQWPRMSDIPRTSRDFSGGSQRQFSSGRFDGFGHRSALDSSSPMDQRSDGSFDENKHRRAREVSPSEQRGNRSLDLTRHRGGFGPSSTDQRRKSSRDGIMRQDINESLMPAEPTLAQNRPDPSSTRVLDEIKAMKPIFKPSTTKPRRRLEGFMGGVAQLVPIEPPIPAETKSTQSNSLSVAQNYDDLIVNSIGSGSSPAGQQSGGPLGGNRRPSSIELQEPRNSGFNMRGGGSSGFGSSSSVPNHPVPPSSAKPKKVARSTSQNSNFGTMNTTTTPPAPYQPVMNQQHLAAANASNSLASQISNPGDPGIRQCTEEGGVLDFSEVDANSPIVPYNHGTTVYYYVLRCLKCKHDPVDSVEAFVAHMEANDLSGKNNIHRNSIKKVQGIKYPPQSAVKQLAWRVKGLPLGGEQDAVDRHNSNVSDAAAQASQSAFAKLAKQRAKIAAKNLSRRTARNMAASTTAAPTTAASASTAPPITAQPTTALTGTDAMDIESPEPDSSMENMHENHGDGMDIESPDSH